jgi:tripartite ATP-independent transporter DctM subunit
MGWVSPTEAAAASVIYTLIVGLFLFRTIKTGELMDIFTSAAKDSSKLFFIILGAGMISLVFSFEGVPDIVKEVVASSELSLPLLILVVNLFFLFCGMFLDPGVIIILFGSIFASALEPAGLHPVQFGIMMIVNCVVGLCTPPVGNILFAVSSVTGVSVGVLSRALVPFLILGFINVLMLGYFDGLTLWLPEMWGLLG